jgi:hypothetical protein
MPERADRRIGNNPLLLGAVIVLLIVVAGVGITLWLRTSAPDVSPTQTTDGQPSLTQFARRDEPLLVTLFYPVDGLLATGSTSVKRHPDTQ